MIQINAGDTETLLVQLFAGNTQITKADMSELTMKLRDVKTGVVINGRTAVDLLPSTATNGDITVSLTSADNVVVDSRLATEQHQILIACTYTGLRGSKSEIISIVNTDRP